nr:RNA polymerase sigma factor [Marinicella rhabdoformis]
MTKAQAQKGKQVAYRRIYDLYKSAVYNLAFRMLQSREDALDVLQNTFVAAFQKMAQHSGDVAFGFWLRKIAVNQSLQLIKKNHRQRESQMSVAELPEQTAVNIDLNLAHDLNVLLQKLPPLSRSVLWLYEVEGFSHKEIADWYQMSVSFSKSQLSRSKKLMAEWLAHQEQDNDQKHNN